MKDFYIIVQAGGRGSRLRHHTWNKPKCLVSVKGKPLLFHLFDRFPSAKFLIIGDYEFDKLENYLSINQPSVEYRLIKTEEKGTCSGIDQALDLVPEDAELMITWSDLIINKVPDFPKVNSPVVITTNAFICRWTIQENKMIEQPGSEGIPGIFYSFSAKNFPKPPKNGEFVKWFSNNIINFEICLCNDLEELGDFSTIEDQNNRLGFSRFFNEVIVSNNVVTKRAIDLKYKNLIDGELKWYKSISNLGFRRIPKILDFESYTMERIHGLHAFQMDDLTEREKRAVLSDYIDSLTSLHDLGHQSFDAQEIEDVYIIKTISRVESVSKIIPNFDKDSMTINGLKCRNVFSNKKIFSQILTSLIPENFTPIHGDPTFSNSLIDKNLRSWFIDPRGYFSKPGIWGDPLYDFSKVYYSAIGGYDSFNRRKFKLHIDSDTVEILMEEPNFSKVGKEIFLDFFGKDLAKIEILHGLIWLALSGYAKDDIDSVIGSFYLGLYYLEQGLKKL